ncbi:NAD(P)-dependent oxidoreductase [Spirosoma arcticum]
MKLIVFGATGGTDRQVVEQALQAGHQVTVVARNPATFSLQHPQLTIRQDDVLQPLGFEPALAGADAVISCLGIQKRELTTVYSQGINNIAQAMRKVGMTRIICISSIAVVVPPRSWWQF